jgi:hypothetical protein
VSTLRDYATLIRNVLWALLVRDAKGEIPLGEMREHVDQAHQLAEDMVRHLEETETAD